MKALSLGFDPAATPSRRDLRAALRSLGLLAYVTLVVSMAIGMAVLVDMHLNQ